MNRDVLFGMAVLLVSGLFNGSFPFPMKHARRWQWENLWLFFTFLALFLFPLLLSITFVPHLRELYAGTPFREFLPALVFGFLWGIAQATYGVAIAAVGMALAVAVVTGMTGSLGSLIPMLVLNPGELFRPKGIALLLSLPILTVGLVLYGIAGRRREKEQAPQAASSGPKMSFAAGLGICIFTGLFGSMLNFGFAFSGSLQRRSIELGAAPIFSTYAVWLIVLTAGFIPNLLYCGYRMIRNRTISSYFRPGWPKDAALGVAMALLWLGGVFGYGMGSTFFRAGTSFGFAFLIVSTVLISNLLGLVTGEWAGTSRQTRRFLNSAVVSILLAMIVLGLGGIF